MTATAETLDAAEVTNPASSRPPLRVGQLAAVIDRPAFDVNLYSVEPDDTGAVLLRFRGSVSR